MAEYLTMQEAEDKFGSKGKANAGLTLGIIGTGLAALSGGMGNCGGLLGGLFGGNRNCGGCSEVQNIEIVPSKYQLMEKECQDNLELTRAIYNTRITDLNEKFDLYTRLNDKITELEKTQVATATALPLTFELSRVNGERYTDNCCCKSEKQLLALDLNIQRQLDRKIDGELKYSYSNLCAPVPNITPLYCSPFTPQGSGTVYQGCNCI